MRARCGSSLRSNATAKKILNQYLAKNSIQISGYCVRIWILGFQFLDFIDFLFRSCLVSRSFVRTIFAVASTVCWMGSGGKHKFVRTTIRNVLFLFFGPKGIYVWERGVVVHRTACFFFLIVIPFRLLFICFTIVFPCPGRKESDTHDKRVVKFGKWLETVQALLKRNAMY